MVSLSSSVIAGACLRSGRTAVLLRMAMGFCILGLHRSLAVLLRDPGTMKGIGQRAADMSKKLAGAVLPGAGQSKGPAGLLRYLESAQARGSQVLMQHADRVFPDHVARARHRKGGDRHAAGERLQLNDPEGVGPARKYEHVRSRQV